MIHINSYKLTPAITATWGDITGNVSNQEDLVEYISTHGGGNAAWGSISGNISDQSDLMSTLGSYATESWVSSQQFVTESWVSEQGYLVSDDLSQYATRQWVTGRGYATESWVSEQGYLTSSALTGYATESWVSSQQFATEAYVRAVNFQTQMGLQGWVQNQGYITSSGLTGYATESWVSSQQFITSSGLTGYATESWVSSQGYVNNSQVVSIFNDCNPLVYDMSSPFATYLESHSVLKYDDVPEPEEWGTSPTNPLVLGYNKFYRPSFGSEVTSNSLEVNGAGLFLRTYNVNFDSSTGQVTDVEKIGEMTPCWIGPTELPLLMMFPEEETGSPTDMGLVWANDYGDYGLLIGVNNTGVDGEFEGLRVDPDGVAGRYVVTGEEDEETGEMNYTDEFHPFVYGEDEGRVIDEFGGIYIKGSSVEIGIDEDGTSSGLRIYDSGQGAEIVRYNIIDDGQGNLTTSEQILATQDWVSTQITNSIGSAMSITNQILS